MSRRLLPLLYSVLASVLSLLVVSRMRLWRVERPTSRLAEMEFGSFWEFLGNLPSAVQGLSVEPSPEYILTVLPTIFLSQNIFITFAILLAGAALALFVRKLLLWIRCRSKRSDAL